MANDKPLDFRVGGPFKKREEGHSSGGTGIHVVFGRLSESGGGPSGNAWDNHDGNCEKEKNRLRRAREDNIIGMRGRNLLVNMAGGNDCTRA